MAAGDLGEARQLRRSVPPRATARRVRASRTGLRARGGSTFDRRLGQVSFTASTPLPPRGAYLDRESTHHM